MHTKLAIAATLGGLALCQSTPASALTLSAGVAPSSGYATQTCSNSVSVSSSHDPVGTGNSCTDIFGAVGTSSGSAVAASGHVGASAHADSHNNDSRVAGIGANAVYADFLRFTSSDPSRTSVNTSVNLLLDGIFENIGTGFSKGELTLKVYLNSPTFAVGVLHMLDGSVLSLSGMSLTHGSFGPLTDASLVSSTISVALDTPVFFEFDLLVDAGASGPDSHGLVDFGSSSVKLPSGTPVFDLPDGVTVNAGDYLVDNRFIDPLTPPVPEPATWALLLCGLSIGALAQPRREGRSDGS